MADGRTGRPRRERDLERGPALCAHTDFECDCDCMCGRGADQGDCLWSDCSCGCDADCKGCALVQEAAGNV